MYKRKDGTWCDTLPRQGSSPKFFYGKSPSEVKQKMKAWREEAENGITVRKAAEMWIVEQEKKVRPATYYNYQKPYRDALERFGDMRVTAVTPNMVQTYIDQIADYGYSKARVQLYLVILRGAFRKAITMPNAAIQYNPCESVKIPKKCKNRVRDLPPKYAVDIVKQNVDRPFGLFPYLLIYSGLRKGEALALTDKDFHDGVISVNKALKYLSSGSEISEPKSEAGVRDVILLKELKEKLPKRWKGYLFSEDGGKTPLTAARFNRLWDDYCIETGLGNREKVVRYKKVNGKKLKVTSYRVVRDICPHQLRHEFCTICFDAGLDPADAAELMGHASEEITREIYTHIQESRRVKTYQKLQDYVSNSY